MGSEKEVRKQEILLTGNIPYWQELLVESLQQTTSKAQP